MGAERVDKVDTFKEKTRFTRILFDSRAFVRTALTAPALAMSQKSGTCPDFWRILVLRECPSSSLFLSKNIVFRQSERPNGRF